MLAPAKGILGLWFLVSLWLVPSFAKFEVPALTGPVVDEAGLLSASERAQISELLFKVQNTGKAQIQVLIVKTLDEEPIEQASIKVVDQWKLGAKKTDNGVLLLVAIQDRKIRIEVGQGLEGDLPDIIASRIVRQVISPLFKQGRYSEGIAQGVLQILQKVAPEFAEGTVPVESRSEGRKKYQLGNKEVIALIILFLLFSIIGRFGGGGRGFRGGYGGGFGGGLGGFGGGGGGGGWSGGGGGFSGGGASGDW